MKIALGTAQFGLHYGISNQAGQIRQQEAASILREALARGIDTLDTAIAYGESEKVLGDCGVCDWNVISKLPGCPDDCRDVASWVEDRISGSLERLKIKRLYGLLMHRPEQLLDKEKGEPLLDALNRFKEKGIIKKIGVSIYQPQELDELYKKMVFDIVQAPLSVMDRRLISSGWLERLQAGGTEVHVRSVFLQGILLMGGGRPQKFKRWEKLWENWEKWLLRNGITPLQACLRYPLSLPQISKVVVGVDSIVQLREILAAAASGEFPQLPDELQSNDPHLLNPSLWSSL